jgi:hypothetical protein
MIAALEKNPDQASIHAAALTRNFFGISAKQGVSIRYPLATCLPTPLCGGRCYGHDGRDREFYLILRGCLNFIVGKIWEAGSEVERADLEKRLVPIIRYGAKMAVNDAELAAKDGYVRPPRIRFSHLGEMIATPRFCNWLATALKEADDRVVCIAYTRHVQANQYNPDLFVVNFSLDGEADRRSKFAPPRSRLVSSAWDGALHSSAEVNFLEHHVEKSASASGLGRVCPVTADHKTYPSCDIARCTKCFDKL